MVRIKKFMFFLMVAGSLLSVMAIVVTLIAGNGTLPIITIVLRGLLIVYAAFLVIKRSTSWVKRGEINVYFLAEAAIVIFNLIYLSLLEPTSVAKLEFIITGTLITPVINIVLVFLGRLSNKYVMFEKESEDERIGQPGERKREELARKTVNQG